MTHGYVEIRKPDHPRVNGSGWVKEHIVIAEKALGRYLPIGVEVHHVNGNKADNRGGNLVICQDRSYHAFLHVQQRALDATGNVGNRRCVRCHKWDDPTISIMIRRGTTEQFAHRACNTQYERDRGERLRREAEKVPTLGA